MSDKTKEKLKKLGALLKKKNERRAQKQPLD